MNLKKLNKKHIQTKEVMSLEEYLKLAQKDKSVYASPQQRLLNAIGDYELFDTSTNDRYSRLFGNKVIKRYPSFKNFFGLETVIEKIVNYLTFSAKNLEERKQILYLFGPPGSAKSSLAEHLKVLFEKEPFYSLAVETPKGIELSPIHESPLGLFTEEDAEELGLPARLFGIIPSPWATKRLDELGDLTKFKVVKLYPSRLRQIAIAKTEPGDDNNQDISALVGKLDIRQLEHFSQNDPDAYKFSGGLCIANQGILDFVEMFKAPINVLNPLLEATQGKNYKGTEALAPIPFDGFIIAHSNEQEWDTFRKNKANEAFLDRVYLVKVPYCLGIEEEKKIYQKQLENSDLAEEPCVGHTLDILAKFAILTRFNETKKDTDVWLKLLTYDGQNIKDKHPNTDTYYEYKSFATAKEGFIGMSTRAAFKLLSKVFNEDVREVAADPVHMLLNLEYYILEQELSDEQSTEWGVFLELIEEDYAKKLGKDIYASCLEAYDSYGQHVLNKYIRLADHWIQEKAYRDPDTGQMFDMDLLNSELKLIENRASISNPKDFRNEVVNFVLRVRAENGGKNPDWKSYNKMREVIECSLFKDIDQIIDVISFDDTGATTQKQKTEDYVSGMKKLGYTAIQAERNLEWFKRRAHSKNS
jgi:serine protein kinase